MGVCVCMGDSLCCIPETNAIVGQLYFNKIYVKKEEERNRCD